MSDIIVTCWKCGGASEDLLLPLSRTEECKHCGTDFHVCRMCRFYDTSVSNDCLEPVAERVTDKTRANFCGYLELRVDAGAQASGSQGSAVEDLQSLFGMDAGSESTSDSGSALNDLFDLSDKMKD